MFWHNGTKRLKPSQELEVGRLENRIQLIQDFISSSVDPFLWFLLGSVKNLLNALRIHCPKVVAVQVVVTVDGSLLFVLEGDGVLVATQVTHYLAPCSLHPAPCSLHPAPYSPTTSLYRRAARATPWRRAGPSCTPTSPPSSSPRSPASTGALQSCPSLPPRPHSLPPSHCPPQPARGAAALLHHLADHLALLQVPPHCPALAQTIVQVSLPAGGGGRQEGAAAGQGGHPHTHTVPSPPLSGILHKLHCTIQCFPGTY